MNQAEQLLTPSWCQDSSPIILSEIVSPDMSVTVWNREFNPTINRYFESVFTALGLGIRTVFSIDSLKQGLKDSLPEGEGKSEAIEDIYLLADMLTCLFGCEHVGLRLAPLNKAMCPRFHTDKIPVRLVNTYMGEGTEWVPAELLSESPDADGRNDMQKANSGYYYHADDIQQLNPFDVALLKGSAWDDDHIAAVHRSCAVNPDEKRVLLTLDPVSM